MTWNVRAASITALALLGCGEDVGTCDSRVSGRDTVLVGGTVVQYGGQAILNASCANGTCHTSTARGKTRNGAPAGLDFDLVPIDEADADGEDENRRGDPIVALTRAQRSGLRTRQREVVARRGSIWQQVRDGLMPPDGLYEGYRQLRAIFDSEDREPCTKAERYGSIRDRAAQEVLRNWLACGAPIVEVNSQTVQWNATPGVVGRQYPMCIGGGVEGEPVSLETLLEGPLGTCANCHPASSSPDLRMLSGASMIVSSDEEICDGKPYVAPGDPEGSFLYDVLSKDKPGCNVRTMPLGSRLTDDQRKLVYDWIAAGAPLTDADLEPADVAEDSELRDVADSVR